MHNVGMRAAPGATAIGPTLLVTVQPDDNAQQEQLVLLASKLPYQNCALHAAPLGNPLPNTTRNLTMRTHVSITNVS